MVSAGACVTRLEKSFHVVPLRRRRRTLPPFSVEMLRFCFLFLLAFTAPASCSPRHQADLIRYETRRYRFLYTDASVILKKNSNKEKLEAAHW